MVLFTKVYGELNSRIQQSLRPSVKKLFAYEKNGTFAKAA